jgi:hypothetical protein
VSEDSYERSEEEAGWPEEVIQAPEPAPPSASLVARLMPGSRGRSALAIAGFLGIPLFFSSLMASTLALEKPGNIQWKGCHSGICTVWHEPTASNIAKVWGWALVPPLVLVLIGAIATRLPLGFYISCIASIVIAMAVVHKTGIWAIHHTARFPLGVDLIPASNHFSNLWDPGEWEKEARETALSLSHWTIGIALAAILVKGFLALRAEQKRRRPPVSGVPMVGASAPSSTMPGTD